MTPFHTGLTIRVTPYGRSARQLVGNFIQLVTDMPPLPDPLHIKDFKLLVELLPKPLVCHSTA